MPGAYVYKTENRQYDYVRDVYSTIIIRDLVEKYKIRNKLEFTNISEFMMDNIGNLLSPNNICETLKNNQSEITRKTVSKYIGYLENAFLFYEAKRYDLKGKKYLTNNSKYYLCDSSFRYAVNGTRNMDYGRVYENIVYLELRRRGYEVYIGKLYKKEIDFVASVFRGVYFRPSENSLFMLNPLFLALKKHDINRASSFCLFCTLPDMYKNYIYPWLSLHFLGIHLWVQTYVPIHVYTIQDVLPIFFYYGLLS